MAKTIKFNLILDNRPIRSIDDIQDNLNIEDLLAAYRNGSLRRWLETRELTEEIAGLDKISGSDDIIAAMELCRIFHGNCTKEQLEAAVYPFEFKQKEIEKLQQYKNLKEEKDAVIRAYHGGYDKLLNELDKRGEEYPFIKAAVQEIFEKYLRLFQMNAGAFYARYIYDFPLVILGILANVNMRPLIFGLSDNPSLTHKDFVFADNIENIFLDITEPERAINSFIERYKSSISQPHVQQCTSQKELDILRDKMENLSKLQGASSGVKILVLKGASSGTSLRQDINKLTVPFTYIGKDPCFFPAHVEAFAGQTEGYWKDIQAKGKRFMIIKMEDGNFIRNAGKTGEELKASEINGRFPIFDGIDYKSNNEKHQLVYMEV
jgi:hypothetical protein